MAAAIYFRVGVSHLWVLGVMGTVVAGLFAKEGRVFLGDFGCEGGDMSACFFDYHFSG
jgi:hypothetical protein